jgi:hypothetical protein
MTPPNAKEGGGGVNGYDEATAWLKEHASQWEVDSSDQVFETVGGTRVPLYKVRLRGSMESRLGDRSSDQPQPTGHGATIVEAVQNALGWREP